MLHFLFSFSLNAKRTKTHIFDTETLLMEEGNVKCVNMRYGSEQNELKKSCSFAHGTRYTIMKFVMRFPSHLLLLLTSSFVPIVGAQKSMEIHNSATHSVNIIKY